MSKEPVRLEFKVGDRVTWSSTSNGCTRKKSGFVVEIVAPREYPSDQWATGMRMYGPFHGDGKPVSFTRDHQSYIIGVVRPTRGQVPLPQYYWPVVSKPRKAD